jgi:Holliday junction resolvase RusA-like endonuclease
MFHQFFGENMLRADVCNAVEELGQLLDHTGPVLASERNAARIFGADHLFFVTNGTSTANKIVWHYVIAPGDVVVVDRNCHKSVLHAIIMTGAIPVFLTPTRNHFGIIGPIPLDEFKPESIQKKIDNHPLLQGKGRKPRVLTITQSTYDGIIYNVDTIKEMLDGYIDTLHFDEAWLPHAAFHDFYQGMHAIGAYLEPPDEPLIGPLVLDVRIVWPYTKSDTQRKSDRDREDLIWHTSKPDLDNWLKGFQDLLVSRKIIKDDCHIVWVIAQKLRGPDRLVGITVSVEQLGEG